MSTLPAPGKVGAVPYTPMLTFEEVLKATTFALFVSMLTMVAVLAAMLGIATDPSWYVSLVYWKILC